MKILVLGLGSIGQRHCRILRSILGDRLDLYTYRQRNLQVVIHDNMSVDNGVDPIQHYRLRACHSLEEAFSLPLDAVYITNPISMHVPTAIQAAERSIPFFIEKPLGHSMEGIDHLSRLVDENDLVTYIGYQMRFHPGLAYIKQQLEEQTLGCIFFAEFHFGEWLPGMHPYEDYRESHAARRGQGGGVILCLSHEIDTANWLFGFPHRVTAMGGHLSSLEMDVEDTAEILMECELYGNRFPVRIHLDFLQKPPKRYCYIVGEKGTLYWDYYEGHVHKCMKDELSSQTIAFEGFQRNDMFLAETKQFLSSLERHEKPLISLQEGIQTLRICLAAKKSLETNESVLL